jgi:hypothetical protein
MDLTWAQQGGKVFNPSDLWPFVALAFGVILLGIGVIVLVDRWRKRSAVDRPSANDQLSQFQALYDQGELSREEFDRIRALLGQRLRKEMDVPATPAATEGIPAPGNVAGRKEAAVPEPPAADGIQSQTPRPPLPGD